MTLSNGVAGWTFTNIGGGIKTIALKEHNLESPEEVEEKGLKTASSIILNEHSKYPIGALSNGVGKFEGLKYEVVSQSKNRIEADRAKLERQRLEIEEKRLEAEETERQLQKMQAEKIKQVRMLLADTITSFDQLKKFRPVP